MSLLKRGSPHARAQSPAAVPHVSAPGSQANSLLQMGGENSAFKALIPHSASHLFARSDHLSRGYTSSDSDEEINVNDESDCEEARSRERNNYDRRYDRSRSHSPVEVDERTVEQSQSCQPLQLTKHDR